VLVESECLAWVLGVHMLVQLGPHKLELEHCMMELEDHRRVLEDYKMVLGHGRKELVLRMKALVLVLLVFSVLYYHQVG